MEKLKEYLKVVVGVGLIVAAVWGVSDFTLPPDLAELVRAAATIVLVLWGRFARREQPRSGEDA